MGAKTLSAELKRADLRLKNIERWAQVAAIVAATATLCSVGFGVYLAHSQAKLAEAQTLEAKEKQRVSFKFRLTPVLLPGGHAFYIRASLRNYAVRQLTVLMVGIRVWENDKWNDSILVRDHQSDVILSDNLVRFPLPPAWKSIPEAWNAMSKGRFRLRELDDITLEPTEQEYEQTFGPYPLKQKQRGMWVTGRAYVAETETGVCAIDTTTEPPTGALPYVCEQGKDGKLDCNHTRCSVAIAPGSYYVSQPSSLFRFGDK